MICSVCKTREARIFYTEIINGEKKEQYLCEECAVKNTSLRLKTPFGGEVFSLGGLLSGLFEGERERIQGKKRGEAAGTAGGEEGIACPDCGMTYGEFRQHGQFGCACCYGNFGKLLARNMKNIQGSDVHVGKRPKNAGEKVEHASDAAPELSEIERLSMQLDQAVEREEYELAASLRDRVRALKREQESREKENREKEKREKEKQEKEKQEKEKQEKEKQEKEKQEKEKQEKEKQEKEKQEKEKQEKEKQEKTKPEKGKQAQEKKPEPEAGEVSR